MAKSNKSVGRRGFLKGAAAGAAVLAAKPALAPAQQQPQQSAQRGAQTPNGAALARENGTARPTASSRVIEHPGSGLDGGGQHADAAERGQGVQSIHSAQDLGALVRDYTKWDDEPYSLGHFAQSAVRAYKISMTPPMGPTLIVANAEIQSHAAEQPLPRIPKLVMTAPPQGDSGAVNEAARLLVNAERPIIIAERAARTQQGIDLLVQLAELLQAPVNNQERMNFPNRHSLASNGGPGYNPDVALCLEMNDLQNETRAARARNGKIISISSLTLSHKSNIQDFGHYADVD